MAFNGYILASADNTTRTFDKYMQYETYKATINVREDIVNYQDDNTLNTTLVVSSGSKSSIAFETKRFNLSQLIAFQNLLTSAMVNVPQKKLYLSYWDCENNIYKTGYFRMNDLKYVILKHSDTDIFYDAFSITLTEM